MLIYLKSQHIIGNVRFIMINSKQEGSIVVVLLGLFWIMGIMSGILYFISAQVDQVLLLREAQIRVWHATQAGLLTGLAHLNDDPMILRIEEGGSSREVKLYQGQWFD